MQRRTSPLVLLPLLALAVAVVAGAGLGWYTGRDDDSDPAGFYGQEVEWRDCEGHQCTSVKVPIDHENPQAGSIQLKVKVIPATGSGGRHLFINPGGPGGSVIGGFDEYMADVLGDEVRDQYDIVAVDPRGVGASEPIDCLSDEALYELNEYDPSPDDARERDRFRTLWKNFAAGCREKSGDLADHMTTEETARDFDIIRDALGAKSFDWFGMSYGTRLGATYATLFPDRVGRMVLDAAEDPSLDFADLTLSQSKGFEVSLEAYIQDCIERGSCPLGSSTKTATQKVISLFEELDREPLKTADPDRPLTEGLASFGITSPLYDKSEWPRLTKAFTAAMNGDGAPFLELSDEYLGWTSEDTFADNIFEVFPLVLCQDEPGRVPPEDVVAHASRFAQDSPVFGESWAWSLAWCEGVATSDHAQPAVDASESAPIVVIGTTRDPATPYEQAVALTKQLGSAVLITREGDGHGGYDMGSSCVDDLVNRYLAEGTVPKRQIVCD
jgi:pimeloyl-ACP methyl ester carboxylesterase